ncbi:MAG TPA: radical SAM protein, partial [Phycisphaerae bacterium]|nr:radical SAM protein [Phycisphaerae bacterium]
LEEVKRVWEGGARLLFFVDDNITSNLAQAKEFLRELARLKVRWVSQSSINAAHDEEFLDLMVRSGCMGVLIGFESLNPANLKSMNKTFNSAQGGFPAAVARLRAKGIRVYATFVFGYDEDSADSFAPTVKFARDAGFYIAAFNHLTPFPGTPLYARLQKEGRLLYEKWWLDPHYKYNRIPFQPRRMSPEELQRSCIEARRQFYSWPSILRRGMDKVNRADGFMWRNFYMINAMHRADVSQRDQYPLGDEGHNVELIRAN